MMNLFGLMLIHLSAFALTGLALYCFLLLSRLLKRLLSKSTDAAADLSAYEREGSGLPVRSLLLRVISRPQKVH